MQFEHNYKKEAFNLNAVNQQSKQNPKKLIDNAEKAYHEQINEIADAIAKNGKYKIVLMAGPSSSGKTTSSNLIREKLAEYGYESLVVSMDDFFLNRENTPLLPNGDYDYENVTALDLEYLNVFVEDLFNKGEAKMPLFNFVSGKREEELKTIKLNANTIVIIEGIHALNPIVFKKHTENMYKIYICVNSNFEIDNQVVIPAQKLRLMRRLIRDYRTRGMSLEATLKMWPNVLAGEDLYIKPYKNRADYLINSTHAYEPLMYAHHLSPRLKILEQTQETQGLINMLAECEYLSVSMLPENSLLHEFLG